MSLRKLTAAVAFAAALSLGLAASAVAHHRVFHKTPGCKISMFAQPAQITDGEPVELYGQLTCNGTPVAGKSVTIRARTNYHHFYKTLGTTTTTSEGTYAVEVPYVRANANFQAFAEPYARSANRAVRVTPMVVLNGPPEGTTLDTGYAHRVTFSGTVTPYDGGAQVVLQREGATSTEEWHRIQVGTVRHNGTFVLIHKFSVPGAAVVRVVIRPNHKFTVRGISNTISYGISQTQNPALTIHTSKTPDVLPATPITVSGVSSAGEGKTVKLFSRPSRSGTFTEIASTTTTAGGAYSFERTPLQNTLYRAEVGTTKSAILFEGVKYALSLTTSFPTSMASGTVLVVEGHVTGAEAGHRVYLERETRFGHAFAVIDLTTVNTEGNFKIQDALFGSGRVVVRVKVAGDPGHLGVRSALADIELTPIPPTLTLPPPTPVLPIEGGI